MGPDECTVSAQRPLTGLLGLARVSRGALPVRTSNELRDHGSVGLSSVLSPLRDPKLGRGPALDVTRMYMAIGVTAASAQNRPRRWTPLTDLTAVSAGNSARGLVTDDAPFHTMYGRPRPRPQAYVREETYAT